MPESAGPARPAERRLDDVEDGVRRSTGLHGLYAAAGLLIGLFLPFAQILSGAEEVEERYTAFGLIFSLPGEQLLDTPSLSVIAGLVIVSTAVTAIGGFLVAARTLDRLAATVALVASAGLTLGVLVCTFLVSLISFLRPSEFEDSGFSVSDPLETWTSGSWVLLLGGLAGCWIAASMRDQFDR